jgi:methionine synthase I (cobalamin-dependent)
MGTELQKRGLPLGTPSHTFTLSRPETVLEVHRAYRAAGAELLLANTFGVYPAAGADPEVPAEEVARAVALARTAAGGEGVVAGSIGPMPTGDPGLARAQGAVLAGWLERAGADAVWIESQLSLPVAMATLEGARAATRLPVLVSFSFHGPGHTTHDGRTPREVAAALAPLEPAALGGNCGDHPAHMAWVLAELAAEALEVPRIARPSAGVPELADGRARYRIDPEAFRALAGDWIRAGARILGGCCGTTPAQIAALRSLLEEGGRGGSGIHLVDI